MASSNIIFILIFLVWLVHLVPAHVISVRTNVQAPSNKFMFAASVACASEHICSAVILNKRWLLTSTLCIKQYSTPETLQIRYGSHNRSHSEIMTNDIEKIVFHPRFEERQMIYNLALINVKSDIKFIPTVVHAAVLPAKEVAENDTVDAIGWEKIDESNQSDTPEILKYHQTHVMPLDSCWKYLKTFELEVNEQVICTHATIEDTFPELDNGSSLISTEKGELIGIASWKDEEFPNVYVGIRAFVPWIRSIIL